MRIMLADPPRGEGYYDLSYPNLGILYLVSYLERHLGEAVQVQYLEGHTDLAGHLEAVRRFKPDLYGLSFALWTTGLAYRTIDAVKEAFPELTVICGGAQPTGAYWQVLERCRADLCVLGEGEATLLELVQRLMAGERELEGIAGLALRDGQGRPQATAKRPFIKDLDSIPLPAWHLVDFSRYSGMHVHKAAPQTHILVSRGCPFDCNFCANPVWKYNKPWVRTRGPESIAQEVKLLYDRGIREVYMTSDEFNVSEKWALSVCEAIAGLNLPDMYFQCNIRADVLTPELARAFARINLWLAHLGIESGNQRTLDGIGKHVTLEQIERACRLLKAEGIKIFGFVMLFHAWEEDGCLAWESPADVDGTLRYCRGLLARKLIDYMSWQVATPMPGSRLWRLAEKYCLIPRKDITNVWEQNLLLPGVGESQVKGKLRKGMILKNYYLVKNGNLSMRHLDRAWRNLRVLAGLSPDAGARRAP